jgi:hypothetical protein
MRSDRRTLLKGLAVLPLAGVPMAGFLTSKVARARTIRFIADTRLPGAAALAATALRQGHAVADPRGEIVAHALAQGPDWLRADGPIIGLTSYTDMMLMRDLARAGGRPMRYAALATGNALPLVDRLEGPEAAFVAALRDAPVRTGRASAFLWLV